MTTLGDRIVSALQKAVGLSAEPDQIEGMKAFLSGGLEDENTAYSMTQVETCGLTLRSGWRTAGVDMPALRRKYIRGDGFQSEVQFARDHGAYLEHLPNLSRPWEWLEPGDAVVVGVGLQCHVCTVETVPDGTDADIVALWGGVTPFWKPGIVTIEGGQVDGRGKQIIQRKQREWTISAKDRSKPITAEVMGALERPIVGIIKVNRLPWLEVA